MNSAALSVPNIGPLARLAEVIADPSTMDAIEARVADGETLKQIAKAWEVPYSRLMKWVEGDQKRSDAYWAAARHAAHADAGIAVKIADEVEPEFVPKARLQIAARQWNAERLAKDHYAQRTEQTAAGGAPLESVSDPVEIARRMLFVMRLADKVNEKVVAELPAPAPAIEAPNEDELI